MGIFKRKNVYYSIENIKKLDCLWNIIWGGRSNGKSYAVKEYCITESYKNNKNFAVIVRYSTDRSRIKEMENYFLDMDIKKLTDGKYDCIICSTELFYFGVIDSKGKRVKKLECGRMLFLDRWEGYKSMVFNDIYNFVLEEFITKTGYLPDEVTITQNLASTVFRDRIVSGECKIWLIGNPLSYVNPYFNEFGLNNFRNQAYDTIDIKEFVGNQGVPIRLAVERCAEVSNQAGLAITSKAQNAEMGEWEWEEVPKITVEELKKYDEKYKFIYSYMGFYFWCIFYTKKNEMFIYIKPFSGKLNDSTRIVGDTFSTSILYTKTFKPLTDRESVVFSLIQQKKLMFCNDETGTNFLVCMRSMQKEKY